jgi:hypothetical protein
MNIQRAVETVVRARGLEDPYALLIARAAEEPGATEKAITKLMFDIMLGVSTSNE